VTVTDVAGNTRSYPAAKLGAGWTRNLTVIGADTVAPTVAAPRDDVPAAGPVRLTFSEPVKGVSSTSLAVHDLSDRLVAGRFDCLTAAGATVSCASGPVTVAVFTPTTAFTDYGYKVTMNPAAAGAARLTDLAGNPGDGRWPSAYFFIA
jgi:hypothetical protein